MRANINNNSTLFKAIEAKLNKSIASICWGIDEDRIYFVDGTFTYCIIELTFDEAIQAEVTILDDNFDVVDKLIINA